MIATPGLELTRASGAQNTFWIANVFDSRWAAVFAKLDSAAKAMFAQKICRGFDGFQTDGLLFICPHPQLDFSWDFYNSDGSHADMCGNASRCATYFFYKKIKPLTLVRFLTGAGEVSGEIISEQCVKIEMTAISQVKKMNILGHEGLFVNTGVPHFVIFKNPDAGIAKALRQVSDFGVEGSNITFVSQIQEQGLKAVTFERGVEDFTRACGTGAVAAAIYFQENKKRHGPVHVQMPGGLLLIANAREGQRPFLTGPVKLEFNMTEFGSFNEKI